MAKVEFRDHSIEVKNAMSSCVMKALEETSGELESQVVRNTAVDTGQLKGSWTHRITSTPEKSQAVVGSPLENAIWEEFGTGEYALHGDGRKGGWVYVDTKGDGHFTKGKTPNRPLHNAFTALKNKLIRRFGEILKSKMGGR